MFFLNTPWNATNAPVSREYQPSSNHIDTDIIFCQNHASVSAPYLNGASVSEMPTSAPLRTDNMQQAFSYPEIGSQFAQFHDTGPGHAPLNMSFPMIKPEVTSWRHMDANLSFATSEPTEGSAVNFATDVDTLMRAIQAKQTNPPQEPEQKVCGLSLSNLAPSR